ncbi:hypothetical protein Tco_0126763 [Tanacetum coccineum]
METESEASFSIGKETRELAVMETIRMDNMDFFEMVNHFFNQPLFPAGIEVSLAGEVDAFQVLVVLDKKKGNNFFLLFAFLSIIGNERRSGGTCGTTYWNAESAPMPLAMPAWSPDTVEVS